MKSTKITQSGISWSAIVMELLLTGRFSLQLLARQVDTSPLLLAQLLENDASNLSIYVGTQLLGLHQLVFGD